MQPSSLSVVLPGSLVEQGDTPVLDVRGLCLAFGGNAAIDEVSFDLRHSELLAIIGPNGAGKTSILNCISGVYRPQRGSIDLVGDSILGERPDEIARRGVARMFQNIELFSNLSVVDNLMLGRHVHLRYGSFQALWHFGRAARQEVEHRNVVEQLIDFLEIEEYRQTLVGMLPYGVKKRVELGRALAMEPRLLLLDEPAAGMNSEETQDMSRFILDVRTELGLAMILIDHDMSMVMDLADRVLVLDFGRRIALGTPQEVQQDAAVIRAYLGDSTSGGTNLRADKE